MPLLLNVPAVRIELTTPGEWVEVKERLSKGDVTRIQAASFRVQVAVERAADPSVDAGLDYEASVFAGLEVGLVAWSFAEPITPANIRALAPEDYDIVTRRVNELWAPRGADERKNSGGNGATPPSGEATYPASSHG